MSFLTNILGAGDANWIQIVIVIIILVIGGLGRLAKWASERAAAGDGRKPDRDAEDEGELGPEDQDLVDEPPSRMPPERVSRAPQPAAPPQMTAAQRRMGATQVPARHVGQAPPRRVVAAPPTAMQSRQQPPQPPTPMQRQAPQVPRPRPGYSPQTPPPQPQRKVASASHAPAGQPRQRPGEGSIKNRQLAKTIVEEVEHLAMASEAHMASAIKGATVTEEVREIRMLVDLGQLADARRAIIYNEILSPPKSLRQAPEMWEL